MSNVNNNVNNKSKQFRRKRRQIYIKSKKPLLYTQPFEFIDRLEIIIETEYVIVQDETLRSNDVPVQNIQNVTVSTEVKNVENKSKNSTVITDIN